MAGIGILRVGRAAGWLVRRGAGSCRHPGISVDCHQRWL